MCICNQNIMSIHMSIYICIDVMIEYRCVYIYIHLNIDALLWMKIYWCKYLPIKKTTTNSTTTGPPNLRKGLPSTCCTTAPPWSLRDDHRDGHDFSSFQHGRCTIDDPRPWGPRSYIRKHETNIEFTPGKWMVGRWRLPFWGKLGPIFRGCWLLFFLRES